MTENQTSTLQPTNKFLLGFGLFTLFVLFLLLNSLHTNDPSATGDPAAVSSESTVATEVIEFDLPEGGIAIPPGGEVTLQLGPSPSDNVIMVEIDEKGATITDPDGNVTHQDTQGNVVEQ